MVGWVWAGLDERGEGPGGGVGVSGGRGAALAAVLPDERPVLVHARCKTSYTMHTASAHNTHATLVTNLKETCLNLLVANEQYVQLICNKKVN